jgi:hypothetical protein
MTIQTPGSNVEQPADCNSTRTSSKTAKTAILTLLAAVLCFFVIPSTTSFASGGDGGGGGGGGFAGKCGTITSISASPVKLTASAGGYTASPLQIRGQVNNCSIYLQRYWIDFSEPANTNTTCKAAFSTFPSTVWSSGSSQSFSASGNITKTAAASPEGCVGAHTATAVLRSRTDGSVLSTVNINYTVSL